MIKIPDEPSVIAQRLEDYIYLFFGPPGVGKTTFVRKVFGKNRTLFLSTDRGTRDQDARRVEVHSWRDVRQVFKKLEGKNTNVEVIVFDHVDDVTGMIDTYVCEFYSGKGRNPVTYESIDEIPHGKGWGLLKRELASLVQRTLRLGVVPVFICHEDTKTIVENGREQIKIVPSMNKQAGKYVLPVANVIGRISLARKKLRKGGNPETVRILQTQPTDTIYLKDRTGRVKPEQGWEVLDAKAFKESFELEKPKGRRAHK